MLLVPFHTGLAQTTQPEGPVYIVQQGDSLWDIAARFRVSMQDLASANGISDPSQLTVNQRLIIPGLQGIQGVLTTLPVAFGDTLLSLSRRYQIPVETLVQLNHITTPSDLYAGSTLVITEEAANVSASNRTMLTPGQSLLELAVSKGTNPWAYVLANDLAGTWSAIPGDTLHLPGEASTTQENDEPSALPDAISSIALKPTTLIQGKVTDIQVTGQPGMSLGGSLNNHDLHFFPDEKGVYTSLQGIHAMAEPGLYTMVLTGTLPIEAPYFGAPFSFSQAVLVESGNYPLDPPLTVSSETVDPAVTGPEDAQWSSLASTFTPDKLWNGKFQNPAADPFKECWPSRFGDRRSFNGSAYTYFHSGLDFCGGVGTEIFAPAAGRVIFAGPLTVRGNATMIDHGWGIYTGYMHQSEFRVKVGDIVQAGQVIGLVGGTGRVTGPHLHWEVWAGGVQVNPMDWLKQAFP